MVIINIDTAKDSAADIKKTIRYLQELVGDQADDNGFTNIFAESESSRSSSDQPSDVGGVMGMFDNPFAPDDNPSTTSLLDDSDDDTDGLGLSEDAGKDSGDDSTFVEIVEY